MAAWEMVHFRYGKFHYGENPMYRFKTSSISAVLQAGLFAILTACQSPAADNGPHKQVPVADAGVHQQMIVKFKAGSFRCNAADIARLAAQSGIRLELVRPMSGGACVIRQLQGGVGDFSQVQKLLQQHPSIEWVEPDAVMKTM